MEGRPAGAYHFVGIGGYGMSAIAQVLLQMGRPVSGSDMRSSERTARLSSLGATIHIGHDPSHVRGAGVVVYSSDVPRDNPELLAAQQQGIPLQHRSEALADLVNNTRGIAISGSHGKTTVTSMIALCLEHAGLDPTAVIGAEVDFYGGNAKLGRGPFLVAEADESDGSFLRYRPQVAVATNVEPEHLDHYGGDFQKLVAAFETFLSGVRPGGLAILCSDDAQLRELAGRLPVPSRLYGLGPEAQVTAIDINFLPEETTFTVRLGGLALGPARLVVPGLHNVSNALAAFAVGLHLGIPFTTLSAALAGFRGARRRFQVVGRPDGITVVDDYAHHPTEIRVTLKAARQRTRNRVIAVFQPQRYVRTQLLLHDFSEAFGQADEIILTDIYSPPGERPIPGVTSQALAELISQREGRAVSCISRHEDLVEHLVTLAQPGDTVLTMGAGDIWKVAARLVERLAPSGQAS